MSDGESESQGSSTHIGSGVWSIVTDSEEEGIDRASSVSDGSSYHDCPREDLQKGWPVRLINVGDVSHVCSCAPPPVQSLGYLQYELGQNVLVQHVGREADEVGWIYGQETASRRSGWIHESALSVGTRTLEDPLGVRASIAALHKRHTTCWACGVTCVNKRCDWCRVARYCNTRCQERHWTSHRCLCKQIRARRATRRAHISKVGQDNRYLLRLAFEASQAFRC